MAMKLPKVPHLSTSYYVNNSQFEKYTCNRVSTDDNYPTWARLIRCSLRAKNKLWFAMAESRCLGVQLVEYLQQYNNAMGIQLIGQDVTRNINFMEYAKTMWDELKERCKVRHQWSIRSKWNYVVCNMTNILID